MSEALEWVAEFSASDGRTEVQNLGGVSWSDAPKPKSLHKCQAQTRGTINYLTLVERCACGGARMDGRGPWLERNSRS